MNNLIIGLGNTGSSIVREIANTPDLTNVDLYAVDSTTANVNMNTIHDIEYVCIISDESQGSGRNRERGAAMYEYHESNGDFDQMYLKAMDAKSPVIVITSAAGGTGSGSVVPLCKSLLEKDVTVIPVIIFPNDADPMAYHLNANDLLIELGEVGINTYSIFVNPANTADYTKINREVVELVEIILGKKYPPTDKDSIDDSDLNTILDTPGRFIAFSAKAPDTTYLKKEVTRKLLSGYQPSWTEQDTETCTFMKAFSLTSMFADTDYADVFAEVNARIINSYDEYRNITVSDNGGVAEATIIVAGLPRHQVKEINSEFNEAKGISDGMKKSTRPKFLKRRRPTIVRETSSTDDGETTESKIKWDE